MTVRRLIIGWWMLLLLAPALARATDVQATLDRSSVQLGETVTLNLRVENASGGMAMPDLSALDQDFSILGTSQNSSLSVVNGAATSSLTFGVALRPKHVGALQIPSLHIAGGQTQPLQLQVIAPDPNAATATNRDVFMEAQVEPQRGYVGQQLSYVTRLYYATSISNGALSAPQLDGVEVSQVGNDLNYDAERGGRTYHVLERRYALIPQHAGRVEIPAVDFQGEAIDPNDPNSFFGSSTPVSASAPAISIDVRATPADWGKSAWLPARQLSLTMDGWPGAQDQVRVGQPLNLTMTLQATGLAYESLPALSLPPLDGAKAYPDKPVVGTRQDGPWLAGRRQQTFAVVPERAGTLTIPATTLKWWNVLTDRMDVAQIPAHQVTVLPAVGSAAVQTSVPAPTSSGAAIVPAAAAPSTPWRWIALGSIGLWLCSMLAWWWRRRRRALPRTVPKDGSTTSRQGQLAFVAAARSGNAAAQAHSLLNWARTERPAIQHLGELAAALDDAEQRAAIARLQQRHYAAAPTADDGAKLADAFKRGFVWRTVDGGHDPSALPPLYPFKLHE
ncbi:BatD family protein [Rhodanobacter umsongensis]|uniref:BatD family protein n=1 Tax=Rhodanobacter umsongensis TaxID=633153 RepID=A0ABW0JPP7_9GAMM